jgi:uncharacterized coiled-coil protein SlyX
MGIAEQVAELERRVQEQEQQLAEQGQIIALAAELAAKITDEEVAEWQKFVEQVRAQVRHSELLP